MANENNVKLTFGPVRLSYPNIFKPKMNDQGVEKYSASFLIPKKDKATILKLQKAVKSVFVNSKDILKTDNFKSLKHTAIRDGDEERSEDEAYEGMYFVNANSDMPPGVLNEKKEKALGPTEIYPGCWVYASITLFAFNKKGNRGIGVGLNNIMKCKDDEPLSGRASAESDFADIEIEDEDMDDLDLDDIL